MLRSSALLAVVGAVFTACAGSLEPRIQTGAGAVVTADGLHKVENVALGRLFMKPDYAFGSYGEFLLGETVLSVQQGSRVLDQDEIAEVKSRFTAIAQEALLETGRKQATERGPCVAVINLALLQLDLDDPQTGGGAKTSVVDSFGAVTLVLEIRDGHTGEALLRYGRRRQLVGGLYIAVDPAKGSALDRDLRQFALAFRRDLSDSLPHLDPIARTLTCAQRAGLAPFEPEADAIREIEQALALEPDFANGARIYASCAGCHQADGSGVSDGAVPQLAGQHREVVIKQLADIRAGNRDNPTMYPFAYAARIGGAQAVADVAGYIGTLGSGAENDKGSGDDLERGQELYGRDCAPCHGAVGEGDGERYIPRIQAQHFAYMERQFQWIKNGRRRNADPAMRAQIQGFSDEEMRAVLDYVSRLAPAQEGSQR